MKPLTSTLRDYQFIYDGAFKAFLVELLNRLEQNTSSDWLCHQLLRYRERRVAIWSRKTNYPTIEHPEIARRFIDAGFDYLVNRNQPLFSGELNINIRHAVEERAAFLLFLLASPPSIRRAFLDGEWLTINELDARQTNNTPH